MDEGDGMPLGAGTGLFVYETQAGGGQLLQNTVDIADPEAEVVYAGAVSLEEFRDGARRSPRGARLWYSPSRETPP